MRDILELIGGCRVRTVIWITYQLYFHQREKASQIYWVCSAWRVSPKEYGR